MKNPFKVTAVKKVTSTLFIENCTDSKAVEYWAIVPEEFEKVIILEDGDEIRSLDLRDKIPLRMKIREEIFEKWARDNFSVGRTISFKKGFMKQLDLYPEIPVQVHLLSATGGMIDISIRDIERCSEYISFSGRIVFAKVPRNCHIGGDKGRMKIREVMNRAKEMSFSGVVTSIPQNLSFEEIRDGFEKMEYIQGDIPLLIETPIKGELSNIKSLCELAESYKLSVSLNVSNVFSSGYDPCEYILYLETRGINISMLNLSDSLGRKGSEKKERTIPFFGRLRNKIIRILELCKSRNIPIIYESLAR